MVTAESLNFDVLQIIFSYLSLSDLASVSLVSQSFLASALPRLYRSLIFYHNQAKPYPRTVTPFAVVKAHPDLAAHVQNIDIRVVPHTRVKQKTLPDPRFLRECISALQITEFLASFTCTIGSALPPLLPFIQSKSSLNTLRIAARLTEEQAKLVCQLPGLRSVTLEHASSAVMDALPKWAESLKSTLEHLTIHVSGFYTWTSTIQRLTKLRGLHVIGCPGVSHVDILSVTDHTPLIESLAFTVMEPDFACVLPRTSLTALKHLAVDLVACNLSPNTGRTTFPSSLLTSLLSLTRFAHLASLALRQSDRQPFPTALVEQIVEMHGTHLRSVRLMGFTLGSQGLQSLMGCEGLEKLAVSVPADNIHAFASALAGTATLHTLIDVGELGMDGKQVSLTTDRVRVLLEGVPSITRVVSESRLWTCRPTAYGPETRLERMKGSRGTGFWFIPPAEGRCV
ncbi:hypothetical protein F5148DRAFT_971713 [Russula earlei]|uniref:Uncharacterized protein n=1 Tax=Russula earlei TaxID=71964 RepID=A0ACC0UQN1_9AGAM|nr:hypothetical protein F5148DRAFT_971713 [Russula earlei]